MKKERAPIHGDRRWASAATEGGDGARWYVLVILTTALVLSYVDRYLMAILVQPIEHDLHLSDTQFGLLNGIAFAVFYAVLGVPIARFADKGRRRMVVVASVMLWSVVTAACGLVQSFWQMATARFGVAVGEAGLIPTSHSLLTQLFPDRRRSTALAIFMSGGTVGLMIALVAGSRLDAAFGWRATFLVMLAPGLLLGVLIALTLRTPPVLQGGQAGLDPADTAPAHPLRLLWSIPAYRHIPFAQSASTIYLIVQIQWLPSFIERSFAVSRVQVGQAIGLGLGLATIAGGIFGGVIADRFAAGDDLWRLRLIICSVLIGATSTVALYLCRSAPAAYGLAAIGGFFLSAPTGAFINFTQTLVPVQVRATASSVALMVAAFLGLGLGPVVIGALSDHWATRFGPDALRYALLTIIPASLAWGLAHFLGMYLEVSKAERRLRSAEA